MGIKSHLISTFGLLCLLLLLPGMLSACGFGESQSSSPPTPGDISRPSATEPASPRNTPAPRLDAGKGQATATTAALPTVAQAMLPEAASPEAKAENHQNAVTPIVPASTQPDGAVEGPPVTPRRNVATPTEASAAQATATEPAAPAATDEASSEESPIENRLAAPSPTSTPTRRRATAAPTRTPTAKATANNSSSPTGAAGVAGHGYDAYLRAATKKHQYYHYTCEFDAAWVVLETYGFDVSLDDQLKAMGQDTSIEPYYKETKNGIVIYGGDITSAYSGDYKTNFLARSTGLAMAKVFEAYGLKVTPVNDRPSLEAALLRGELVWMKTTADFKPGRPATWIMPDGRTWKTVLGNDHAAVVIGFNKDVVVMRDVLGPTSTNWQRKYEYEVKWPTFMAAWGSQSYDALAVAPPGR